jgi:hypothetical protein
MVAFVHTYPTIGIGLVSVADSEFSPPGMANTATTEHATTMALSVTRCECDRVAALT